MSEISNNYVEIYLSYNEIEADLIKELFENEGISIILRDLHITPYPISIGRFAEKRIAVPVDKVHKAKELIEQAIADGFLDKNEGRFKE